MKSGALLLERNSTSSNEIGLEVYNYGAITYKSEIGAGLTFSNVPWLAEMYAESAPHQATRKCSQVGLTTLAIVRMIALAKSGVPGMYVLPDNAFRSNWVREKFHPIISHNPRWRQAITTAYKTADSIEVKHLFGIPWKYVGASQRKNFYSFSAAAAIVDEFDQCNLDNLALLANRFGRQEKTWLYLFGNPTLPGIGIDAEYQNSDKRTWMIKCPHCGQWQEPRWRQNVVRQVDEFTWELRDPDWPNTIDPATIDFEAAVDARVYCFKCDGELDRLAKGYWVKEYKERFKVGWGINKIFADVRRRAVLLELFFGDSGLLKSLGNENKLEAFYNNELGIPYRPAGSAVSEELLNRCIATQDDWLGPYNSPAAPILGRDRRPIETIGGVDINPAYGHVFHIEQVDQDGLRRKLAAIRCRSWEEVQDVKDLWNVQTGVVDINPEREAARRFVENNADWYTCEFVSGDIKGPYRVEYSAQHIQANRTVTLDRAYRDYQLRGVLLPADYASLGEGDFVDQMTSSVRKLVEVKGKTLSKVVAVWDEGAARDDDRLACAYAKIAASLAASEPILEVV